MSTNPSEGVSKEERDGGVALCVREGSDCPKLNDGDHRVRCLQQRTETRATSQVDQDEEMDKMLGEVTLSAVLILMVGVQLPRYLQQIQPSREERVQEIPGMWERSIPDTSGECASQGGHLTGSVFCEQRRTGG